MIKNILIIDDFRISNEIVSEKLQAKGYKTYTCQKTSDVFEHLNSVKIDAVISDYIMPEINGIELMSKIKEVPGYEKVPVIILSSINDKEIIDEAYSKKAAYWMIKPINIDKIDVLLKKLFAR